ncbi:MAG: Crp/Fnr family transcriptional regulator [Saprospiraceae bacterium]|nr:Crp/Fnr family transcriptional regulator [Bacteroidia bacterium]MBT8230159.1 Crp/Fnr family transcriptional regulator [Bacteroidia bacterium]NNF21173.1 Crp/Fnr family transcriptional regulator [Saprospiraceae bacterium]NNK89703.1 Crp/Fnr family transcriptional regulator [Saprospiraceae bacterium]
MNEKAIWYLENIDVGGIFCPKKMGEQIDKDHLKIVEKNEYVYLPNQSSDKIFFITDGRIKIGSYADNGKEITKTILGKGEVFGELSMIGETSRRDYALALEDTTLCVINANEMKNLIKDHSSLSLFFMKMMGSKVIEMENRLESLVFKDSRSRIVEYLAELVRKRGQRVGYEWVVRNFITHQEIANLTATSRQTVTTVLNELRNEDILTFNRKRLLVRDLDKLKEEIK